MEKKKRNYFKSLFKTVDVFLAIILGLVVACGLYYVDNHNLMGRFSKTLITYFLPVCKSALIVGIVGLFLFLLPLFKSNKIQKTDALLVGVLSASIGGLISFALNDCSQLMIYVWSFSLALSVIYLLVRIVMYQKSVEDSVEDGETFTKHYYALVARKYNQILVYGIGAVLGLLTLKLTDLGAFLGSDPALYCLGAVVCFSALIIVYTVLVGKKGKVNLIDAVLALLLGYVLFIGGFLISTRMVRFDLLWALGFGSLFLAVVIRSLFVSVNVPVVVEKKGPKNYYGLLFTKYGATMPVSLGLFLGLLIDLCGRLGFATTFKRGMTSYFAILIICGLTVAAVLFSLGLAKKGLTSKKVNLVDFVALSGVVGSAVAALVLYQYVTTFRLCLVLIPFAICATITVVRMFLVEVVNQEPVVDDELVLKLKVTVEDDAIRAYCNDKEIAVIDNRTEVKEEEKEVAAPVEEKVEEKEPVKEEEPVEESEEEESVEEDTEDDEADESVDTVVEEVLVDDKNKLNIAKRSFENKIKFTSDKTKAYYSILKNELLSYRTKSKISKKYESFRKKGLFAKLSVSGKSLRIHLALDPKAFDESKFHQIDLGEKKAFKDVPFTMKIRSDLACRRACELMSLVADSRGIRKNAKYEAVNFAEGLDVDGVAILEKVGELSKYAEIVTREQAEALTDDVLKFIPVIRKPKAANKEMVNVYIDTALKYVENTISYETLREAQQVAIAEEMINVKSRTGLDKKITVICDDIDPVAAKTVILTGGKIFKIERK